MKEKKLTEKDIKILKNAIETANNILTNYCEFLDTYILTNEEIEMIEDEEEKAEAKEMKRIDKLFEKASKILED